MLRGSQSRKAGRHRGLAPCGSEHVMQARGDPPVSPLGGTRIPRHPAVPHERDGRGVRLPPQLHQDFKRLIIRLAFFISAEGERTRGIWEKDFPYCFILNVEL